MRTIIRSLELQNESIKLTKQDDSLYVLEKFYKGQRTVCCEFPTSLYTEALRYYDNLAEDMVDEFAMKSPDSGIVH